MMTLDEIARGLTDAQAHAVRNMRGFDEPGDVVKGLAKALGVQFSPDRIAGSTLSALYRKGLAQRSRFGAWLTPLGLAVRKIIQEQNND